MWGLAGITYFYFYLISSPVCQSLPQTDIWRDFQKLMIYSPSLNWKERGSPIWRVMLRNPVEEPEMMLTEAALVWWECQPGAASDWLTMINATREEEEGWVAAHCKQWMLCQTGPGYRSEDRQTGQLGEVCHLPPLSIHLLTDVGCVWLPRMRTI